MLAACKTQMQPYELHRQFSPHTKSGTILRSWASQLFCRQTRGKYDKRRAVNRNKNSRSSQVPRNALVLLWQVAKSLLDPIIRESDPINHQEARSANFVGDSFVAENSCCRMRSLVGGFLLWLLMPLVVLLKWIPVCCRAEPRLEPP
ncbi:hypothetical protein LX32DRAFT_440726 [Colletotrichum zoysiae]|uniref:Uncharacterized protein n=1 Tax=Colletotrichum zoysiae TaxID=1216348 RepID=A0AAD9HEG7_9PEZI|nr:hypothetical protein LX32DRAFT_440726 [Colletotrichum zoysiae]